MAMTTLASGDAAACAAQLQLLASSCDFTEQRNRGACEQYAEQLMQLHRMLTESDAPRHLSSLYPDCIVVLLAIPVDTIAVAQRPLPQLVTEVWASILRAVLKLADLALRRSPRVTALVVKLTDAIRLLSKDRSDLGPRACCLSAAQQLLAAFLASDVASNALIDAPLVPAQLAHPVKSSAQAPRLSSMALVPHLMRLAFMQQLPAAAQQQLQAADDDTWIGFFPQDWLVYIRKGMDAKDFAIKEASVQCLSECLAIAVLPEAHNAAVVEALLRIADGSFTSPKLLGSVSRALGEILALLGVGADAVSMIQRRDGSSAGGQSYWGGLWKTPPTTASASASSAAVASATGDPWSLLNGWIKPPMTKTAQTMLGDAVGHFLGRCSALRPQWYASAAAKLMPVVFPTATDNRAYAPKIVTRAVGLWCDASASCDAHRHAILASMMPFMKADLPKQVAQTALACMNHLLGAIRCLRSDVATQLFAMTKALAITMTHVASAASEVCARTASFDIAVQHALFRMHSDLMEDVTREAPLTHAFVGVSKVLLALPVNVLVRHHTTVMEMFYGTFWTLGDLRTAGDGDAGATSEALARRWELGHQFIQGIFSASRAQPSVFHLSNALRGAVVERCHEHASKLAAWAKAATHPAWLRMALAVSTTLRSTTESAEPLDNHKNASAMLAAALLAMLRAAIPNPAAQNPQPPSAPSSSITSSNASTVLHVKLRTELFCGVYQLAKRCQAQDYETQLTHGRSVKYLTAVALQEVRNAVALQCPCFRTDDQVYPSFVAPLMSTCRRTSPAVHQQPSAVAADAAMDMLAIFFAHPKSPLTHRIDVIRGLFDILAAPCPDALVARWNVVCAVERVLERDAVATAGEPWKQQQLQATAHMLRLQLVQQFLNSTTLDVQCVAAKALAHLANVLDDTEAVVSKTVIEAPTVADVTQQCGALLLFGECCGSKAAVHSLPLVTSHIVAVLRQSSGLFGDPCSGMAIAASTCVILIARRHGDAVAQDVFNVHLQHAFYLKPSASAIDPLVKSLLWGATCRMLRGERTRGDGAAPRLCSAVGMTLSIWCTALTSFVEPTCVKCSIRLMQDVVGDNLQATTNDNAVAEAVPTTTRVLLPLLLPLRSRVGVGASVAEAILQMGSAAALSLKDLAQRVDASQDVEERVLWTRVGEAHVRSIVGTGTGTDSAILKEIMSIITAKAPIALHADDDGDDGTQAEDVRTVNAKKSEAYGEDVAEGAPSGAAAAASTSARTSVGVASRRVFTTDVPAKEAAAVWLVVFLRSLSLEEFDAHVTTVVEDVLRTMCIVASLADLHNHLVPTATHLVTSVISSFFKKTTTNSMEHRDRKSTVVVPTFRTQVAGAVKQLARAVAVDAASCEAACCMCETYASSALADDVSVGRVAQAVIQRICAVEDHTTPPQRHNGDSCRLMALVARLLRCALLPEPERGSSGAQWPSVVSCVRLAMTTQSVQEVLHRMSIAVMVSIGTSERWSSGLGRRRVAVDATELCGADDCSIVDFFTLVAGSSSVGAGESLAMSQQMGPTLRHSIGACACAVVGDIATRDAIVQSGRLLLESVKVVRQVQRQQQEAIVALLAHALEMQVHHKKDTAAVQTVLKSLLPLSNIARSCQLLQAPLEAAAALSDDQVDWIMHQLLARDNPLQEQIAQRLTPTRLLAVRALDKTEFDSVVASWHCDSSDTCVFIRSLAGASTTPGAATADALISVHSMESTTFSQLAACLLESFPRVLPPYLVAVCALRSQHTVPVTAFFTAIAPLALSTMIKEKDVWGSAVLPCAATVAKVVRCPETLQSVAAIIAGALQHDDLLRHNIPLLPLLDREELRALMTRVPKVSEPAAAVGAHPSSAKPAASKRTKLAINIQQFT